MVHVSKYKIKKETLLRISEKLIEQCARLKTKKHAQRFLTELFSETERIMLAKRFAILILLQQGYSFTIITQTLKVSPSTIARVARHKKQGRFNFLVKQIGGRPTSQISRGSNNFLLSLETLLRAGLPPRGKGRWRATYRLTESMYQEAKRRRENRQK